MMLSSEKFNPHPLQYLNDIIAFSTPLPEKFYNGLIENYKKATDVETNRIVYQRDGLKVTGISCFPLKTEAGKHPIYIYNRGGNRNFGMLTLYSVNQAMIPFARNGYLAYASNYRGNDGGEGIEEFGGADLNDIKNLIEIAKQNPAWDGKNIFMLGHSRGGMMTYKYLRDNKNITAAVSNAGVADIIQGGKERPELIEKVYKQLIKVPESETEQAYIDRSAVYWADKITTPLLLQHGTSDDRVDVSHSINLDKKLTCPHELIIYQNGNHALAAQWKDVLEKSMIWFERYRK